MKLLQGDCLDLIDEIPKSSIDMILTDPPYSSGGLFAGDRKQSTGVKYTNRDYNGAAALPDFNGDNMDQMSFHWFMRNVLSRYRPKVKPGGIVALFTDWRQIALAINALQAAGFVYRGIVAWDKGNSRNIPHRFRNDCEYVVWGTHGPREAKMEKGIPAYPGCYHIKGMCTRKKHHQTEKPVELLEQLVAIAPKGGTVLDMFMGSGSTGVACANTGRDFVGVELDGYYTEVARRRIEEALHRE